MPLIVQPDVIEVSDHTGGFSPDGVDETTDAATFIDVLNLLVDRNTGSIETRKGFRRLRPDALSEETVGALVSADHYIHQLFPFETDGIQYVICVVVKDAAEADNVQLFAIRTDTLAVERFDTTGETWSNPTAYHWHQSIDATLYGGSKGNPMWSWDGTTYDATVSTPNTKAWVDATGAGVTTASEYGRDYAWTGKELVSYSGDIFMPNKDIRYADWEADRHYQKFDRVSKKLDGYYRSYRCTETHVASLTNRPDDGADWNTVWDRVKLGAPQDEDGETQSNWAYVPEAAQTSIAAWFADRLFLRFDGQGDNSRLQYSAPVKPDKGQDIANVSWSPNDWAPGNDFKGQGGGWIPFNDGKHGGAITALHSFGQYLIVFKRKSVWVLSGSDDTTWTVRRVARGVGAFGPLAVAEHDGLVYFLGDRGLYATDGTAAEEVPGNAKVEHWLKARIEAMLQANLTAGHNRMEGIQPTLFKRDGFLGITLPLDGDEVPYLTVFYEPETESWWKTDIPALDWAGYYDEGTNVQVFAHAVDGDEPLTLVYVYDHEDANDEDDDGESPTAYASVPIEWSLKTAWLQFSGVTHEMRRIRRVWLLVKAAASTTFSLSEYRDFESSASSTSAPTKTGDLASYLEGKVIPDAHALQLELEGNAAPAAFLGYGVHTQRRRSRYHA